MATYEVLGPGGHARLVSDIKAYVNRADGVGTTQIADESVTSAKLADDVTDTLDHVESFTDPMNKNGLHGELAEGALLTADDVYAAPPRDVDVFGVSTQSGTPTPSAPVEIKSVDDLTLALTGKNIFDATQMKDQAPWNVIPVYAPVSTTLTMSTNCIATSSGTGLLCFFRLPSGAQSSTVQVINTHPVTLTVDERGFVEVVQRRASGEDSFANYQWQIELGTTATAYEPYVGQSVEIPLSNNKVRSLPDGTRDTVTLSYIGPSTEHEGWGVFGASLNQNVDTLTLNGTTKKIWGTTQPSGRTHALVDFGAGYLPNKPTANICMCDKLQGMTGNSEWSATSGIGIASDRFIRFVHPDIDGMTDAEVNTWLTQNNLFVQFALATPITHDLGTVELPILPNPLTAWADGGSAQPTLSMGYERDVNIVISNMMSVIADAATS